MTSVTALQAAGLRLGLQNTSGLRQWGRSVKNKESLDLVSSSSEWKHRSPTKKRGSVSPERETHGWGERASVAVGERTGHRHLGLSTSRRPKKVSKLSSTVP